MMFSITLLNLVVFSTTSGSIAPVRKRGQLPRADVPCQVQHAFPSPLPFQEVFMAIESDSFFDILFRVLRKPDKLRRHPTQIPQHPANDFLAPVVAPVRECN